MKILSEVYHELQPQFQEFQDVMGLNAVLHSVEGRMAAERFRKEEDVLVPVLCCALAGLVVALATACILPSQSMNSTLPEEEARSPTPPAVSDMSTFRIWAMTSMNVAYGFSLAAQGLIVVPLEAKTLFAEYASPALGLLAALTGVAQLIGPEAGHWSDTYRSWLGRRRPLLLLSMFMVCSLSFALWTLSRLELRWAFAATFFLQQFAWNVLQSTQAGIVPDLVPPSRQGFAGGSTAANVLGGAVIGFAVIHATSSWDYHWMYAIMSGLVLFCGLMVVVAAQEEPSLNLPADPTADVCGFARVTRNYSVDLRQYPNFGLLLVVKTLYCAAVVVKGFLLFFVQDTFRLSSPDSSKELVSQLSATAEISAAMAALLVMRLLDGCRYHSLFDRDGEEETLPAAAMTSPRSLVAMWSGSAWMAFFWLGPAYVGIQANSSALSAESFVREWMAIMMPGMALWGLGQGTYLAGDQAMSFTLLPDQKQASRYLGFTSICSFAGCCLGGSVAGGLLSILGQGAKEGYALPGYVAIFAFASLLSLVQGIIGSQIRVPPPARSGGKQLVLPPGDEKLYG
eukprot:TRINITY_DN15235_c0_g1_i2.p1 TRINITY_DN15235_c0_g1~~TRINITY_DN15235_c0_g1_i2.p1  ORF type:complete len:569 (-),score=127.49 TRINITY_DN15235_c0_g1_i2:90-1796(-)